jgi:hypothetical protein
MRNRENLNSQWFAQKGFGSQQSPEAMKRYMMIQVLTG